MAKQSALSFVSRKTGFSKGSSCCCYYYYLLWQKYRVNIFLFYVMQSEIYYAKVNVIQRRPYLFLHHW